MTRQDELQERAQRGEWRAQINLGLALWAGEDDVERDLIGAYAWLRCAQSAGVPYVGEPIEMMYEEMSDEQTLQALARAEEFNRAYCPKCP